MFLLRCHSLLYESPKCAPEICKIFQSHMSTGKFVRVRVLPSLSKQMTNKDVKLDEVQQLQFKMKGVHGIIEMAKKGQVQQAELLFKKLQKTPQMKLGVGLCMALFDMHVKAGNVLEATDALQRLHSLHPHVILQPYKVLNFASLLLQHDQTQQCLQLLQDEAPDEGHHSPQQLQQQQWESGSRPNIMTRLGQRLLLIAADGGDAALTQRLLDELVHRGYCTTSRVLLAPLVRVHLARSDYKGALQALEEVGAKHRCLPCKAELLLALVTERDTESLTRLMELSSAVIGRPQAVFDLAIALLEAGQLDKATRVIQEEEVLLHPERVQYLCKLYVNTRQPQHLQSFLTLARTSGKSAEEVLKIQAHLFVCHELVGNTIAANDLLAGLQREGVTKEDLLAYVPARQLQLQKGKMLDEANAELPLPSVLPRHAEPLQRLCSLSRGAQMWEQGNSSRPNSLSNDASLHSDDNDIFEQHGNRQSISSLSRDHRQKRKKPTERSHQSNVRYGERSRYNEVAFADDSGVRRSSRRRRDAASIDDVW